MFKVMALLKRKPGLSLEEFIERYEGEHVPFVMKYRDEDQALHEALPQAWLVGGLRRRGGGA